LGGHRWEIQSKGQVLGRRFEGDCLCGLCRSDGQREPRIPEGTRLSRCVVRNPVCLGGVASATPSFRYARTSGDVVPNRAKIVESLPCPGYSDNHRALSASTLSSERILPSQMSSPAASSRSRRSSHPFSCVVHKSRPVWVCLPRPCARLPSRMAKRAVPVGEDRWLNIPSATAEVS
jgi:hypothetical protein